MAKAQLEVQVALEGRQEAEVVAVEEPILEVEAQVVAELEAR